jgi:coenzyme PQQ precursor peptide PqqA
VKQIFSFRPATAARRGTAPAKVWGAEGFTLRPNYLSTGANMRWTKPEAEIVAVTMEVTAYVATL